MIFEKINLLIVMIIDNAFIKRKMFSEVVLQPRKNNLKNTKKISYILKRFASFVFPFIS